LPNIKAAIKWARQSEKRHVRNVDVKTRLKTLVKKARAVGAEAAVVTLAESQLDKAASKGIIHPNKAARKKSRLAKAVRRAAAAPPETKPARRAK
jgi:small subunit ribosomal protein S20